jgi:thiol-disulfide isomerase/thioredoxin
VIERRLDESIGEEISMNGRLLNRACLSIANTLVLAATAGAAPPTVQQMLELKPTQRFVDFDVPTADRTSTLKADLVNEGKSKVWVLRETTGRVYRRFIDSDRDGVVDQWVYYQGGVEVYRDVDTNSNGRADQFRWMNSGGTRWAIDSNEDGKVDAYRLLSPEEATREALRAIVLKDFSILEPTLPKPADATLYGRATTPERIKDVTAAAREQFSALVAKLSELTADSQWLRFEASVPMLVPGEAADGSRDVTVYRNATAVIQTGERIDVLQFGEIVVTNRSARLMELPTIVAPKTPVVAQANTVYSNVVPGAETPEPAQPGDAELQAAMTQLQKLDADSAKIGNDEAAQARHQLQRSEVLRQLAELAKSDEDRNEWQKQRADSLITAIQLNSSEEAAKRLAEFFETVRQQENGAGLASFIAFRKISVDYFRKMQAPASDFAAVQKEWLENLDKFVTEYPEADDAPEALSQLAIGMEFTGKEDTARKYYAKLTESFPNSLLAPRARGAIERFDLVGKAITLRGAELRKGTVDVQQLRGKVVLIDYWATTCDPWKNDLPKLKELYSKYHAKGFEIIGVSLDTEKGTVAKFVQSAAIPWPVVFEPGGLDSAPALQFGILALPTQFLVDDQGKVVSRSIHVGQLEDELKKLIKE